MPATNLHLTLRFLGNVDEAGLEQLNLELGAIRFPLFELALGEFGAFGSGRLKRVLWVGVAAGGEAAAELTARVEEACVKTGLRPEERPLRAHVTLARARDRRGAPAPELGAPPKLEPWTVREFILFRSKPGPHGSEYIPLQRFSLDRLSSVWS